MQSATVWVPGPLARLTGGSIYNRRMVEGLRALGWSIEVHELDASFPEPTSSACAAAARALSTIEDGRTVVVDGLIYGALPDGVEIHHTRLNLVALVHMPLALEVGLAEAIALRRREAELRALSFARAIIVTGRPTIGALAAMGHRRPAPVLVEPGSDAAPLARGSGQPVPHLLCVAALTPGKGHEGLVRALAGVSEQATLTCVGSLDKDAATANRLVRLVEELSLGDRVSFTGELSRERLEAEYDRADVFVLNTRRETYGMAVAEAIAHGLPVISTKTGAIPEVVGSGAGLLVDPDDEVALTRALRILVGDPGERTRCRAGAARARLRLRPWDQAAERLGDTLRSLSRHA
jgi:glycosyltransferase involved in cell wall biosynthesis